MRYENTIGALGNLLRSVLDDTKYVFFASGRRLGETVAGLVILSAAIGANVATFGMIDRDLFGTPEGISNSEQVVTLSGNGLYYRTYQDIVENAGFLSLSGRSGSSEHTFGNGPDAELIEVDFVTASYLDVLGVRPLMGRGFLPSDDDTAEGEFSAIVSYRFWQTRFGGRPVLGTDINISNEPYVIVGVTPDRFNGVELEDIDVWLPSGALGSSLLTRNWLHVVGRLQDGATLSQANSEILSFLEGDLAGGRLVDSAGNPVSPWEGARLVPVNEGFLSRFLGLDPTIWAVIGAGLSLLLIGISNFTSLLLSRSFHRGMEMSIRTCLGASPLRIGRQLVTEAALLGAACGGLSLLLALWTMPVLRELFVLPALENTFVSTRVVVFSFVLAFCCSLVASLPAISLAIGNEGRVHSGQHISRDGRVINTRSVLLTVQVALSVLALFTAGLFVRSLHNALNLPFGITPDNVLMISGPLDRVGYNRADARDLYRKMLERLTLLPDVTAVSPTLSTPYTSYTMLDWSAPGYESPYYSAANPILPPNPVANIVTPDFFPMLGMRVLRGRGFIDSDTMNNPLVAVVNERMAMDVWRGEDPIGKCLLVGGDTTCRQVVGVVNSIRKSVRFSQSVDPWFYVPFDQWPATSRGSAGLLVKTQQDDASAIRAVRDAIQSTDPNLPYMSIGPISDELDSATNRWRRGAIVFGGLAIVALVLTVVGIYSVLAFSMQQRTREMGIRLAVGASRLEMFRMASQTGMRPVLTGLALGILAALAFMRFLSTLLFGITPTDPVTIFVGSLIVILAGFMACFLPALRAAQTDPASLVRCE